MEKESISAEKKKPTESIWNTLNFTWIHHKMKCVRNMITLEWSSNTDADVGVADKYLKRNKNIQHICGTSDKARINSHKNVQNQWAKKTTTKWKKWKKERKKETTNYKCKIDSLFLCVYSVCHSFIHLYSIHPFFIVFIFTNVRSMNRSIIGLLSTSYVIH